MNSSLFWRAAGPLCGLLLLYGCTSGKDAPPGPPPPPTYTISGIIYSAANTRVDGDINDTASGVPFQANDGFATAQALPNPASVGGYVNVAGQGAEGRSYQDGDVDDFYSATLQSGDTIRLALPDEDDTDASQVQLRLYNGSQTLVDALTLGNGDNDLLSAPAEGGYFIRVSALLGGTSYRLIVGAALQNSGMASKAEFVPGEVLVKFKPAGRGASAAQKAALASELGMGLSPGAGGQWARMRSPDLSATFERLHIGAKPMTVAGLSGSAQVTALRHDTLRLVRALKRHPDVAHAQPNYIRRASVVPDDPLYPLQWHYHLIHAQSAWDHWDPLEPGSSNVIVAVIDSGILDDHPDLESKRVPGYDFVSDSDGAGDNNGIDSDPADPNGDSGYHGTHVAGIIAAAFDNTTGIAGIGGATRIMPVRVLGATGGNDDDIAKGIRWAAGLAVTGANNTPIPAPAQAAHIINMSLGGEETSQVLTDAIAAVRAAGVILIAASGNDGTDALNYPAAYPEVVSVSAVGADAQAAFYSNFGDTIDVAAPGGDTSVDLQPDGYADGILSTLGDVTSGDATYGYYQGTSMATPHVAGVAALMKAVNPAMDADDFDAYLINGQLSADLGAAGRDNLYGYGLIDAYKAVAAAGAAPASAVIAVTPGYVQLDGFTSSAQIAASQLGSGSLTLNAVQSGESWLSVSPSSGSLGLGQYSLSVDRSSLSGGIHEATLTFDSSANDVQVPVRAEVLPDTAASASVLYLRLVRSSSLSAVRQFNLTLTPVNGVYTFTISGVPQGDYYLICGSNLDNDDFITDQGEALGIYPPLETDGIDLDSDLANVVFLAGFAQNPFSLPAAALLVLDLDKKGVAAHE